MECTSCSHCLFLKVFILLCKMSGVICIVLCWRDLQFNNFTYVYEWSDFNTTLHERRKDFTLPFHAITNLRQPSRGCVISGGVFAPNLGKVAPHKDWQICPIAILNVLGDFYCKIQLYCIFIHTLTRKYRIFIHLFVFSEA